MSHITWIRCPQKLYNALNFHHVTHSDFLAYRRTPNLYIDNAAYRASSVNKAAIDRRLRPRCCHQGSYCKRPKSSSMRPLACKWYHCAQFIAKPKAACALRFSCAATSSNLGL